MTARRSGCNWARSWMRCCLSSACCATSQLAINIHFAKSAATVLCLIAIAARAARCHPAVAIYVRSASSTRHLFIRYTRHFSMTRLWRCWCNAGSIRVIGSWPPLRHFLLRDAFVSQTTLASSCPYHCTGLVSCAGDLIRVRIWLGTCDRSGALISCPLPSASSDCVAGKARRVRPAGNASKSPPYALQFEAHLQVHGSR